jgi:hypothetical protein
MMSQEEKDTLINTNKLIEIINAKFEHLEAKMDVRFEGMQKQIDTRFESMQKQIDTRFEGVRLQMVSFDVRIDRVEASTHKVLEITINTRADVKVLREKINALANDVRQLQKERTLA